MTFYNFNTGTSIPWVWEDRLEDLKKLIEMGYNQTELAAHFQISRQRMNQILQHHGLLSFLRYHQARSKLYLTSTSEELRQEYIKKWNLENNQDLYRQQKHKFMIKKRAAAAAGFDWNLEIKDIVWNTHCPMLGIELDYFAETRQENSPSFDRIDNSLGYVKGNVQIISLRANRIKSDASLEELEKIVKYLQTLTKSVPSTLESQGPNVI